MLDAILEDGRLAIEAITGASAGAMNAVVLVEGWLEGGAEGARAQLETFWRRVSLDGRLSPVAARPVRPAPRLLERTSSGPTCWRGRFSPYETNPLNINPLRDALADLIDFERVRACDGVRLFITATNVWTGKVAVFRRPELTRRPPHGVGLPADACSRRSRSTASPIGTAATWAIRPCSRSSTRRSTDDILLVQINPVERRETPRTAREIQNRLNEITFNGNLLRELRAVEFVTRLIDDGKLSTTDYKRVLMHRIDGSGVLDDYLASSRLNAEWDFFLRLRDAGRKATRTG